MISIYQFLVNILDFLSGNIPILVKPYSVCSVSALEQLNKAEENQTSWPRLSSFHCRIYCATLLYLSILSSLFLLQQMEALRQTLCLGAPYLTPFPGLDSYCCSYTISMSFLMFNRYKCYNISHFRKPPLTSISSYFSVALLPDIVGPPDRDLCSYYLYFLI